MSGISGNKSSSIEPVLVPFGCEFLLLLLLLLLLYRPIVDQLHRLICYSFAWVHLALVPWWPPCSLAVCPGAPVTGSSGDTQPGSEGANTNLLTLSCHSLRINSKRAEGVGGYLDYDNLQGSGVLWEQGERGSVKTMKRAWIRGHFLSLSWGGWCNKGHIAPNSSVSAFSVAKTIHINKLRNALNTACNWKKWGEMSWRFLAMLYHNIYTICMELIHWLS